MGGVKAPPDYARRQVRKCFRMMLMVHIISWVSLIVYMNGRVK